MAKKRTKKFSLKDNPITKPQWTVHGGELGSEDYETYTSEEEANNRAKQIVSVDGPPVYVLKWIPESAVRVIEPPIVIEPVSLN